MDGEPFEGGKAKKLIREILANGTLVITEHARKEMLDDDLTRQDAMNVLRGGLISEPAEEVKQTWRYRVRTRRMVVVVAFRSERELVIVTAWRL